MVVAPLVLCLLVCAAADVGDGKKLGRMGVKTVVCFLVSTAVAIVLGLVTSNIIGVGDWRNDSADCNSDGYNRQRSLNARYPHQHNTE